MFTTDPDPAQFDAMVKRAFGTLPERFRTMAKDVLVRTEEFAGEDVLRDLEIESPWDLLGLYQGVDLTRQSMSDPQPWPAMVFLYRKPILHLWRQGGDTLEHIVTHVLVHEIGHHFGLSDDDMYWLEDEARGDGG